jgi:metal-dependent amidase/aminoacylase/carboxypeptidase family protein
MPDKAVDALAIGARIVVDLQTIVSQSIPAADHAVVSVTGFKSNGARNVLADEVTISGDCRGFEKRTSQAIEGRMRAIVNSVCEAWGARAQMDYSTSFVPLVNHEENTSICTQAASQVPSATVDDAYGRVGFSEDFAKMLMHKPGAYILMGNGVGGDHHGQALHNANYDFNDEAIPYGVAYWCALANL